MKRIICLTIALCIVLGSFSFCFADFGTTDSTNLSTIKNLLSSGGAIYNFLNTISGRLYSSNNSIAYWVKGIYDNTFLNGEGTLAQICNGAKTYLNNISNKIDLTNAYNSQILAKMPSTDIAGLLAYPESNGGVITWHPYLYSNQKSVSEWMNEVYNIFNATMSSATVPADAMFASNHTMNLNAITSLGNINTVPIAIGNRSFTQLLAYMLVTLNNNLAADYQQTWRAAYNGYYSTQTVGNWTDIDSSYTFTPSSMTDGIYKYLNAIQVPVSRLSYVLASDERIEAQEAAAANEEAVVDNFIDNSGAGSSSPSDIESISDLSSGYKSNFGSDASVSGIFNIFNSNNMGWFSQETANQLDTTISTRRGSSFDTPLLDQQINNIYDQIGVKHD